VQTEAQWALRGKNADSDDYDILACSNGSLSRANFTDAMSRFHLGAVDPLPQVSVSYARPAHPGAAGYLALAIDDFAAGGQRTAHDRNGRKIRYTSYFCLPYRPMAERAIGYLSAYDALRAVLLPETSGPPLRVTLAASATRTLAIDPLARRVAPLLLTGQPVCVLGAEATTTVERLRFIDAVMDLLPYGLRARMAAATWTRAIHSGHRFRLFFSDAPRLGSQPDHVVTWGEPSRVAVPGGPPAEYLGWLEHNVGPLAQLPELTTEISFGPKTGIRVLELAVPSSADPPSPPPGDAGEEALLACAEHAKAGNLIQLRFDISNLKRFAEDEINETRRERYRELIAEHGLLRASEPTEKLADRLYDPLLRMAFGTPLSYADYCQVEHCAGVAAGDAPQRELLMAMVKAGLADSVTSAIVYWHLRKTDEKKLNRFLASAQADAVQMIGQLAHGWTYPEHARIFCDVTLEYLKTAAGTYEPQKVRSVLREHGFLARTLQLRHPDKEQYQVRALYQFLKAAYPAGLGRSGIVEVLAGSGHPPTPALLAAVLLPGSGQADAELACQAYTYGSLTLIDVNSATAGRMRNIVRDVTGASFPAPVEEPPEPDSAEPPVS
jgi:hypothetical protein